MLKDLLRSLFRLSGGQALPAANSYVEYWGSVKNGDWTDLIAAPFDGYLVLFMQYGTQAEVSDVTSWLRACAKTDGYGAGIFIPVRKGDLVNWFASYGQLSGTYYCRFVRLVGGA